MRSRTSCAILTEQEMRKILANFLVGAGPGPVPPDDLDKFFDWASEVLFNCCLLRLVLSGDVFVSWGDGEAIFKRMPKKAEFLRLVDELERTTPTAGRAIVDKFTKGNDNETH